MKNTFAAYRHLPTDKVHILDLALFQKQRMPDGATSLACEYTNEDGEKVFAVIASGERDEPGVTYVPLSEKENAEIMQWFLKGEHSADWLNVTKKEITIGEHKFTMRISDPDHVVATVEIIKPAKS